MCLSLILFLFVQPICIDNHRGHELSAACWISIIKLMKISINKNYLCVICGLFMRFYSIHEFKFCHKQLLRAFWSWNSQSDTINVAGIVLVGATVGFIIYIDAFECFEIKHTCNKTWAIMRNKWKNTIGSERGGNDMSWNC
jgi:hypothetical protein